MNPLFNAHQIIFLSLLTGCAILFLLHGLKQLPTRLIIPIPVLLVQPYLYTWLCATHTGHHITSAAHQKRLHDYPYDHVLFRPDHMCVTCHLDKPARSKHCNFCGVCIAMCDHHCPWVNSCVGRGNYRYFLALLLSLGVLEVYGAYLSWWLLRPYISIEPSNPFFSRAFANNLVDAAAVAVNVGGLSIAGVGMLAAATGALPFGLLAYHCYLIWAGMTTNESSKWADWREDMRDGLVFKGSRKALQSHDRLRKTDQHASTSMNGSDDLASFTEATQHEPNVPWPISSDQVLIYRPDGRAPPGEEKLWMRVWSLKDVDNIYDLGGWNNFIEVLKGR